MEMTFPPSPRPYGSGGGSTSMQLQAHSPASTTSPAAPQPIPAGINVAPGSNEIATEQLVTTAHEIPSNAVNRMATAPLDVAAAQHGSRRDMGNSSETSSSRISFNMAEGRKSRQLVSRHMPTPMEWRHYSSMCIKLFNVPREVTTWDIYRAVERHAAIQSIDFFENKQGGKNGTARVRMEPPTRNPWSNRLLEIQFVGLDSTPKTCRVGVDIDPFGFRHTEQQIISPLKRPVPAVMKLTLAAIWFGLRYQKNAMMMMQGIEHHGPNSDDTLQVEVNFRTRLIDVHFSAELWDLQQRRVTRQAFRMEIALSNLKGLVRQELPSGRQAVIINLEHPPIVYRRNPDVASTHSADKMLWVEKDLWNRQVNIMRDARPMRGAAIGIRKQGQHIDIGRWTTYRLEFDRSSTDWLSVEQHLSDFNVMTKVNSDHAFKFVDRIEPTAWNSFNKDVETASPTLDAQSALALLEEQHIHLPFAVRYQLEVCMSWGYLDEYSMDTAFFQKLAELGEKEAKLLLEYIAENKAQIWDPCSIFAMQGQVSLDTDLEQTERTKDYLVMVRRITVTPTKVYLHSPVLETTNRVLRHYVKNKDRFLRIQFSDELPRGKIFPMHDAKRDDELFTRIFRVLQNGIWVAGRHYQLLAFGSSQFRENGAYFFSGIGDLTCEAIRKWMGDFSRIKHVAKYVARLGQCFSTTRPAPGLRSTLVRIEDVERNGHCFTDGVGKISDFRAAMLSREFGTQRASAFQYRMGGCKGVLAVWDDAKLYEVHIRPSQEKFTGCTWNGLEIIKSSSTSTPTLNQQAIIILSTLGVEDCVFLRLLENEIQGINKAMRDPQEAVMQLGRRVDENQTTIAMAKMVLNGFMDSGEPFMWTLLQLWRSWSMKFLKEKSRLTIEDGAFVLGIVDETSTLRGHSRITEGNSEGARMARQKRELLPQIFLQVPDKNTEGAYKIITGICIVGRNPSLHPGDIRVVEAVDNPLLRHLRDVVVFPMQGDRDVPSMCSGGDLDGDDFFVMWNPDLIPHPTEWNYPPMNYTAAVVKPTDSEPTMKNLSAFFVIYMKNDSLARIATAHRAQADFLVGQAKHPKCLQLAELHSQAVDYVKSGVQVIMPKHLSPQSWPTWMERAKGKTYRSNRILGKMYDKVQTVNFKPVYDRAFDDRILKLCPNDPEQLRMARKFKSLYDTAMRRLMGQKEINTEFEIWSGFVLSKPRFTSDYKQAEEIGRAAASLKATFRDMVTAHAGRGFETLAPFVAAMYRVTQEEVRIALHEARTFGRARVAAAMPLISFPWLFDRELGLMATGRAQEPRVFDYMGMQAATRQQPGGRTSDANEIEESTEVLLEKALELEADEIEAMEYVRDADGVLRHRGEPLNFFHHYEDEADDEDLFTRRSKGEVEGWDMPTPDITGVEQSIFPFTDVTPGEGDTEKAADANLGPVELPPPTTGRKESFQEAILKAMSDEGLSQTTDALTDGVKQGTMDLETAALIQDVLRGSYPAEAAKLRDSMQRAPSHLAGKENAGPSGPVKVSSGVSTAAHQTSAAAGEDDGEDEDESEEVEEVVLGGGENAMAKAARLFGGVRG